METDAASLLKRHQGSEESAIALRRVTLEPQAESVLKDEEAAWGRQLWRSGVSEGRTVHLSGAMIGALAQRLRAREWARAMASRRKAFLEPDLEAWAKRWWKGKREEQRTLPEPRSES